MSSVDVVILRGYSGHRVSKSDKNSDLMDIISLIGSDLLRFQGRASFSDRETCPLRPELLTSLCWFGSRHRRSSPRRTPSDLLSYTGPSKDTFDIMNLNSVFKVRVD